MKLDCFIDTYDRPISAYHIIFQNFELALIDQGFYILFTNNIIYTYKLVSTARVLKLFAL